MYNTIHSLVHQWFSDWISATQTLYLDPILTQIHVKGELHKSCVNDESGASDKNDKYPKAIIIYNMLHGCAVCTMHSFIDYNYGWIDQFLTIIVQN